ncbi:hypothetical protein [Coleofasciculus sp. FACHB-T130]|nr:hypothetical protein [Coleofasciculus sp. FACHB-T130]
MVWLHEIDGTVMERSRCADKSVRASLFEVTIASAGDECDRC